MTREPRARVVRSGRVRAIHEDGTQLRCEIPRPMDGRSGSVAVAVALNGQNFDSGTAQKEAESASGVVDPHLFLYYAQVVRFLVPAGGPIVGGTVVTVSGDGFDAFDGQPQTARCIFEFAGQRATGRVRSIADAQTLECEAPSAGTPRGAALKVALNGVHFVGGVEGPTQKGCAAPLLPPPPTPSRPGRPCP